MNNIEERSIIHSLETYIEQDQIYNDFKNECKKGNALKKIKELSDFNKFCIIHCDDIFCVLDALGMIETLCQTHESELSNEILKIIEELKKEPN